LRIARYREGFDLSLEEFVVGSVVDHGGLSVLLDTYLFQRQRRACDVLREGLSCLGGSGWDVNRSIDTESGVRFGKRCTAQSSRLGKGAGWC
jgi:hypothetical protein